MYSTVLQSSMCLSSAALLQGRFGEGIKTLDRSKLAWVDHAALRALHGRPSFSLSASLFPHMSDRIPPKNQDKELLHRVCVNADMVCGSPTKGAIHLSLSTRACLGLGDARQGGERYAGRRRGYTRRDLRYAHWTNVRSSSSWAGRKSFSRQPRMMGGAALPLGWSIVQLRSRGVYGALPGVVREGCDAESVRPGLVDAVAEVARRQGLEGQPRGR